MCSKENETIEHALFHSNLLELFDFAHPLAFDLLAHSNPMGEINDWWKENFEHPIPPSKSTIDVKSSMLALWWATWNARNEAIFRGKVINSPQIFKYAICLRVLVNLSKKKFQIFRLLKSTVFFLLRQIVVF